MLAGEISKDRAILEKFITFLTIRGLDAVAVSKSIDAAVIGIYMDFLEQNYNIGITADNASYTLYYIPVDENNRHYETFIQKYKENMNSIVFHMHTLPVCTTVIDRYIAGIAKAIQFLILPF